MLYSLFNNHLIENREIRIFLSSTFSDMDKERTALVRLFHKLKLEANKRCVSLSLIDLRWGVTADESRTGKVLSVCLKEIENSHPFFIGLLGNRYGHTPKASELDMNPELIERYPWIREDIALGRSTTEIEIQYGALRNLKGIDAAFFIKENKEMPPDDDYRLTTLKMKIRAQKHLPVYCFDSSTMLCNQVEKTILGILDKYFCDKDNTRLGRERNIQQAYVTSRHRFYMPQQENFDRLDNFLADNERYLVVTGKSGIGKSALIANWLKRLDKESDTGYNVIYHFVGNSLGGNNYSEVLQHISDEIFELYEGLETKMGNYESLEDKAQRYMTDAVKKGDKPILIVIDGINQIDGHDQVKLLNWLPQSDHKVKYLFSTLPDDNTMQTFIRKGYPVYTMKPLEERKKFISSYLSLVGKKLDESQIERILHNKNTENILVLKTLLDELVNFGSYKFLDQRINFYLSADSVTNFFARILMCLEDEYKCARQILSLIAVSEHGLSEDELLTMTRIRQMDFHIFFCAISFHLTSYRGQFVFSHQYIKDAVLLSYDLANQSASKPYREMIICYFSREDTEKDNRQISELAFQYYHINDNRNLYRTILNFDAFKYFSMTSTGSTQLFSYWKRLNENKKRKYKLRDYLDLSYENIPLIDLPYLFIGHFARAYFADTDTALMYAKTYLMMTQLYGNPYSPDMATCYNDIGSIYLERGDYGHAQEYLEQASEIGEACPDVEDTLIAAIYNNIGMLHENTGDYDRAIENFRKAIDLCKKVYGTDKPETAISIDNLGTVYRKKDDYKMALKYHSKAIEIFENVLGTEHHDTAVSYNNVGLDYDALGIYDMAMKYHEQALSIRKKTLGPEHIDTSYSLVNIGRVYRNQMDYKLALDYYFKALEIQKKSLAPKHPCIAATYSHIGSSYDLMEDYREALNYHQKARFIQEETLGEHNDTATTYYNIACIHYFLGEYDMAFEYHKKAIRIRKKKLWENHPDLGRSYCNIGNVHRQRGDFKQALSNYLQAVKILEISLTPAHEDTITTYYNISDTYAEMEEMENAARWFHKATRLDGE